MTLSRTLLGVFGLLMAQFFVLSNPALAIKNVNSASACCVYYKGGESTMCQVYNPNDNAPWEVNLDGGNQMVETFSCSKYNPETDTVGKDPLKIIGTGFYIHDINVVGYFQFDQPNPGQAAPTSCYTVPGYSSDFLSAPLSAYDKNRCEYAANLGSPDSIIFNDAFLEAEEGFGYQAEKMELKGKIEQKLLSESENVCCVPTDPSINKCTAGSGQPDKIFVDHDYTKESLEKILDVLQTPFKGGGDTSDLAKLDYFSCPDTHKKYPSPCGGSAMMEKPSDKYTNTPETATIGTYCSKTEYDPPKNESADKEKISKGDDLAGLASLAKTELNRIGTTNVSEFLGRAIGVLMGIMGSIALAMFVYAGFLFMVSGTTDSVEKARSILVWSSMGMVVVFASYALVQLIFATF